MIKKQDEKKFALTDVDPIAYKTARTFCAKQFLVLSQTILQSAENGFRTCRHPFYKPCRGEYRVKRMRECFPEGVLPLTNFPQTVFCPERFASFRRPLYQRLKVNFLTAHPSPGFHRKMRKQHTGSDLQM